MISSLSPVRSYSRNSVITLVADPDDLLPVHLVIT
jgi:hypothetical protein